MIVLGSCASLPLSKLFHESDWKMKEGMSHKSALAPIFLTVLLDMLGVGIVIPVLPALFSSPESSILPLGISDHDKAIMYSLVIAVYPFMQFFGAPILGALSDKYGRKPILQLSLVGALIGYLLLAVAISMKSLPLLFIARALPGFMGGNISIIFSAISDMTHTDPQNRPKYFGLVGAAFGIGFIIGPALGGVLADREVLSWFNHSTPFYFTAALTLLNLILIQFNFPETLAEKKQSDMSLLTGVRNVKKAFSFANLRALFTVSLLYSLGFSFFTQFFAYYMMERFGIYERQTGIIFAWVGLWLVFTQLVLVRRLSGKVPPKNILKYSLLALACAIPCLLIPQGNPWWVLAVNPFIAVAQGLSSPNLTSLVSSNASADQQGEILGINQSMVSLGQFLPALMGGFLTGVYLQGPILAAGFFIFLAWAVFMRTQRS
jgi:MFS transporter, DHA1 family, tetracycline resistance protein